MFIILVNAMMWVLGNSNMGRSTAKAEESGKHLKIVFESYQLCD